VSERRLSLHVSIANTLLQRCLHRRSSQSLPRSSWRNLRDCTLSYRHSNRLCLCTIMATTIRRPLRHGHRYRCEERYSTYILCRDGSRSYSWRTRHVLAALGCCWYLLGLLRQRDRQRHRSDRMAPSAWICLHSIFHSGNRYLLLPGISPLAHEARPLRPGFQVHEYSARTPDHCSPRLLLLVRHLR
jgi:hypothetical protein